MRSDPFWLAYPLENWAESKGNVVFQGLEFTNAKAQVYHSFELNAFPNIEFQQEIFEFTKPKNQGLPEVKSPWRKEGKSAKAIIIF